DAIQNNHDVLVEFNHAFGLFQHHFGDGGVVLWRFVEGGADHFTVAGTQDLLHFRHFFRAFVHQQHDQINLGMVGQDGVGSVLEQRGFSGAGGGYDESALAFADGGEEVDDAGGVVVGVKFEVQALGGVIGSQ